MELRQHQGRLSITLLAIAASMKSCLILNERAGGMSLVRDWVLQEAKRRKITAFRPADAGAAVDAAHSAVRAGFQRLLIAGGDGTMNKLVNALARHWDRVEFAVLPAGTGNDWARSLGVPVHDFAAAWDLALTEEARPTDLVHITGTVPQYCINAVTAGIGARVSTDVEPDEKRRLGPIAYWLTAVMRSVQLQEYMVRLEWEDQSRELAVYGIVIANGNFVGGGFPVAPSARLDDGKFDVIVVPTLSALELIEEGLNYIMTGKVSDRIPSIRTTRIRIESLPALHFSVDGEPSRAATTTFEILPAALRVVRREEGAPASSFQRFQWKT
jgi:YegS/Rv2252/BmrU family lipid kinase